MSFTTHSLPGIDGVLSILLKLCVKSISLPVSIILQTTLETRSLLASWTWSGMTPIYKKDDKLNPDNCRLIRQTHINYSQNYKIYYSWQLFVQFNTVPPSQHGLVPSRSVVTNFLKCVDDWSVDINYLDFLKAFDCVPHTRLLFKRDRHWICGNLLQNSWRVDRRFCVSVSDCYLSELSKVSQSLVLRPILFLIYVAGLYVKSDISMFADDIKLYTNPLLNHVQLEEDLLKVSE